MPTQTPDTEKICKLCKENCSDRPRVKDRKGNYYCRKCYIEARRKIEVKRQAQASAPAPPSVPQDQAGEETERVGSLTEHEASLSSVDQEGDKCEKCGAPMPDDAAVCTECGYHVDLGQRLEAEIDQRTAANESTEQPPTPPPVAQ